MISRVVWAPIVLISMELMVVEGNGGNVTLYFGCGCFWHMQHEFALLEQVLLHRSGGEVSARTAYGGSKLLGNRGLVCYHNSQEIADYGTLGYAEVVGLTIPDSSFAEFAAKFWENCPQGQRRDPQDLGAEYRSIVGLPGGVASPYAKTLMAADYGKTKLVAGMGGDEDVHKQVWVYDTAEFPARLAERYHQFHDDMMEMYPASYHALKRFTNTTGCPETMLNGMGDGASSILFGFVIFVVFLAFGACCVACGKGLFGLQFKRRHSEDNLLDA